MGLRSLSEILLQCLLGATLGILIEPAFVMAHGVQIQSKTTSAVEIKAIYDSGDPMAGAQVRVFSPGDPSTPVFSGITDKHGHFSFVPDNLGDWEVSVRQAGHGDIVVIPVTEAGVTTTGFTESGGLSALQRGVVAGAVTWGCVGTALYFRRGKR